EVLRTALDALVDAEVRARLAERSVRLTPARRGRTAASEAATEAWLVALVGEPSFTAEQPRLRELSEQLDNWRASGVQDSPVRICFRLRSPDQAEVDVADDEDGRNWRVEFLLQAVDEPSVLVPAGEVWRATDSVLTRWVAEPQELLLTGLGKASRLLPELDGALREAHPVALQVDAEGA